MSASRFDQLRIVVSVLVLFRRDILTVPERTDHKRVFNAAFVEAKQYLVSNFRKPHCAAVLARCHHCHPRPVALAWTFLPWILHLDSAQLVRVLIVGNQTDGYSFDRARFMFL